MKKRKTFKHAFLFFLSPFRGRLFPLLSVTRLFEIVTRSCLDISISRHPLSAIAIPSLLFAPLLTNLVTPTIAEPPILGQEKKEDVQARLPLFSFSLSRAALPLLSVTRLFEIVTRSCLDISISRHPLSAIAIPSLLFAPLLSNLVTPTIAEPPILGQEKRKTFKHAFLLREISC